MKKDKKHFTNRKIARSMAKFNMKRAGFQKINRPHRTGVYKSHQTSPFQDYWKKYVFPRGVLG